MPFKTKRRVVLVKLETVEGTDVAPTATDAVYLASAPRFTTGAEFENPNEDAHHGGLGQHSELPASGEFGELTIETWLRGRDTAANLASLKPFEDGLHQISGAGVTVVSTSGAEKVTYKYGLNTGEKSATVYYYDGGLLHKLLGCRARASFLFELGRGIRATWVIRGLHSEADASPPAVSFPVEPKPPLVKASAFTLGAWAAIWSRMQIDLNTELSMRPGPSEADGLLPYFIGDYNPTMGLDPEKVAIATMDVRGKWRSKEGLAMSCGPLGSVAGNRIKVAAPKTQLRVPGHGERNLYSTFDLTCGLKIDQGQDFVSFEYT